MKKIKILLIEIVLANSLLKLSIVMFFIVFTLFLSIPLQSHAYSENLDLAAIGLPEYDTGYDSGYYIWREPNDASIWNMSMSGEDKDPNGQHTVHFSGSIEATSGSMTIDTYNFEYNWDGTKDQIISCSSTFASFYAAAGGYHDKIIIDLSPNVDGLLFNLEYEYQKDSNKIFLGEKSINPLSHEFLLHTYTPYTAKLMSEASYQMELLLQDRILFDSWWGMGNHPPEYSGQLFDVLALQGGSGWQYIGQTSVYETTSDWIASSLIVPEKLRGLETQVRFVLNDYGPITDPIVYLNNIRSTPIPEPATGFLLGTGLLCLIGFGSKKFSRK